MKYAITPYGVGNYVGSRAIKDDEPLASDETFSVPEQDMTRLVLGEDELSLVAGPVGPTLAEFTAVIVGLLDATARDRQYDSALSLATYSASGNPAWAAEANTFIAWRDTVWAYALTQLALVSSAQRATPSSTDDFASEVRAACPIEWPE